MGTHAPQLMQAIGNTFTIESTFDIAAVGHIAIQSPHKLHFSLSIIGTSGEDSYSPSPINVVALDAAAIPPSTDSLISFGPSALPAIKMPSLLLSTDRPCGRSGNLRRQSCNLRRRPGRVRLLFHRDM